MMNEPKKPEPSPVPEADSSDSPGATDGDIGDEVLKEVPGGISGHVPRPTSQPTGSAYL